MRPHFRRGGCVKNPSGKDQLYLAEIDAITLREFQSLKGPPAALTLGFRNGLKYDHIIRGWVEYWNQVLQPKPPLDANLVKALIASESGFREGVETQVKNKDRRAYGLMQVLGASFKIMRDEKGEIRDHYLNIPDINYKSPSANIAAGTRWLIHKYELHRKAHPRGTWLDAVAAYKSLSPSHEIMKELNKTYQLLSKAP